MGSRYVKIPKQQFVEADIETCMELKPMSRFPEYFGNETPAGAKFKIIALLKMSDVDCNNKYLNQGIRAHISDGKDALKRIIENEGYDLAEELPQVMIKTGAKRPYWLLEGRTRYRALELLGAEYILCYVYYEMPEGQAVEFAMIANNRKQKSKNTIGTYSLDDVKSGIRTMIKAGSFDNLTRKEIKEKIAGVSENQTAAEQADLLTIVLTELGGTSSAYTFDGKGDAIRANVLEYISDKLNTENEKLYPISAQKASFLNDAHKAAIEWAATGLKPLFAAYTANYNRHPDRPAWMWHQRAKEVETARQNILSIAEHIDLIVELIEPKNIKFVPAVPEANHPMDRLINYREVI